MMNKTTRIYVVRHGESVFNRDEIVSGHVDPELTDAGRKQVEATKQKLANVRFDEAYSSDLQRAIETAEIIYGKAVPKPNRWPKLRERDFGDYDGQPSA
jgi:broad specificity phosphatase PhoE